MKFLFVIALFFLFGCDKHIQDTDRTIFIQKLDALKFLSEYHDQLHVMIGEEEGDADKAFEEFSSALRKNNNSELIPIREALRKIKSFSISSDEVMKLDYLVDYYQSGLSLQVEAILRGNGYLKTFPLDSAVIIYNRLSGL
tara:strand:- start:1040 stop:1462 length:423 start_codon:yes stop_codon:yes gene_type:complete